MYEKIFRNGILPALDAVNGTRVGRTLADLERSQWLPVDELQSLQRRKLGEMLDWTTRNSGFYRDHWRHAPDARRPRSAYPELDGIPLVGKDDFRARPGDFPVVGHGGRTLRIQTSGSTGAPTTFFRSATQESWFWALRMRMWEWAGWHPGEPYVAINLNVRTAWKKRLQDVLFRCSYLTYNAARLDSERILDVVRTTGSRHINAFGSSLFALARWMDQRGVECRQIRALTTTGDNLYPAQRALIERVFGVAPTDYYGAGGEGVHLASQCERRAGYHAHLENAVVEIIADGRPARPGEIGRVVVTQLDNRAMPLVRYDLGDLATAADGRACPCGRSLPIAIESLSGRACDVVVVPGGASLLPQFFFIGAFKRLDHVARYQVVQEVEDRITIRLVPENGCDRPACERSLAAEIAGATNRALGVDFDWVPEIELSGLGKVRPVLSKLSRAGEASR